ncbi:ubiquitin carboxyl-terminal hydrolase 43 [Anopheles cruzii]|uniref:ubiquitin carboxyl-terminal hydrolase 43 n=1 Tax=Anopheles cruzii TaxID=68878 RepID=UPI0022EC821C|nr:ubiquitin carboxyl-terminal hydrolase 43 [Anopheles cruzii]
MEKNNTLDVAKAAPGSGGPRSASSASKLKRAFSMPRNPFQGSRNGNASSSAKVSSSAASNSSSATMDNRTGGGGSDTNVTSSTPGTVEAGGVANGEKKIFRRLSVKKFINRIAQQMTNRTVSNHKFDKTQPSPPPQSFATGNAAGIAATAGGGAASGNFVWPPDSVPGVIGLRNHGNTCFMNAVLQCLSHTDILAQYFVLDLYKADLKRRNKINAKKFGTKGELTEQLALVLKSLWTCRDAPDYSSNFKAVVDRYGSQFRSSTQHDAQEFLFWLLDKVHEDLNTATKRKYKTIKNNGRSDEVIAAETLANYVRCNNSFVQAVFQAQFRSSLSCPTCGKQSNTFDPFYCLSVPLPQLSQQPVLVKVIYASQQPKQVKLGLGIPHGSPVLALREQLHADTGIALDRMILTEICESGFSRVFCDSHLMSSIRETDPLYCIECPTMAATGQSQDVSTGGTKILLCLCNGKRGGGPDGAGAVKRFGTPFCVVVNRDVSYGELQKLLLKEMSTILRSDVFTFATPAQSLFRLRLQDPSCDADTYLEATVEHPLFTEVIDLALSVLPVDAGPAHVKLLLEWTEPERFFADMSDAFVEHESVNLMRERIPASSALTLEQCFEHYTKAETLGQDNAWKCPHCQQYLPVVKTLGLWSLPDIMVIHLKRFRQQQLRATTQAAKLTNLVKFPLRGFDMTPHLARDHSHLSSQQQQHPLQPNGGGSAYSASTTAETDHWSPWRKIKRHSTQTHSNFSAAVNGRRTAAAAATATVMDNRYDLYAVCYHQGDTLETGHYTAACKNPYDSQWYRFDDQRVSHVPNDRIDEEIINNEAYLLFYQRRKLPPDGSECSGSSSSSSGDHWVSKIIVPPTAGVTTTTTTGVTSATLERNKKSPQPPPEMASVPPPAGGKGKDFSTTGPATVGGKDPAGGSPTVSETVADNEPMAEVPKTSQPVVASVSLETEPETGCEKSPKPTGSAAKLESTIPSPSPSSSSSAALPVEACGAATTSTPDAKETSPMVARAEGSSGVSTPPDVTSPPTRSSSSSPIPLVVRIVEAKAKPATGPQPSTEAKPADDDDVATKVQLSLRQQPTVDQRSTVDHNKQPAAFGQPPATTGRFSLPSSQQYQDILWRENMSELMQNHHNHHHHHMHHHHRPSSFTAYKGVIDAGDAVSLMRSANTCSKDTLLYIDQHQGHGLVDRLDDDDDSDELLPGGSAGSRALWISPVTPHKLITVSPKN